MNTKKILYIALAICFAAPVSRAQQQAGWIRKNVISPDGSQIAFNYQDDIWVVSSQGGTARQITTNAAHDADPVWTNDGRSIVFSSYRNGSRDIYVIDINTLESRRITFFPGNETPVAMHPNGKLIFTANIMQDASFGDFPGNPQLYSVSLAGERPNLVTSLNIANISFGKDGTILYEDNKGYEDAMRKHHTSSVTRDVWMYKGASDEVLDGNGTFTKMSGFYAGESRNPVFAPDGKSYYFISEAGGNFNIWKGDLSAPGKATQITFLPTHPVRYISAASNGLIAFSYNGDLYTVREGQDPKKLTVLVARDETEKQKSRKTALSGVTDLCAFPNGKEIAFVSHGNVFVMTTDATTAKCITNTPEQERGVSVSKDGRSIYYASERNGYWGIYRTSLTDKEDRFFTYSFKMKEEAVTTPGQTCFQPAVSPDGKWLAFLRDRTELVVKNLKSGDEKSLLKDVNYSYRDGDMEFSWSPDSQYILSTYEANGGWNNPDVALVNIKSGEITNLTESGYSDGNFKWALGGNAMTWSSDKYGYRSHGSWGSEEDILIMFFDPEKHFEFTRDEAGDKLEKFLKEDTNEAKKEEKEAKKDSLKAEKDQLKLNLILEGREDRTVRLTRVSGMMADYVLSEDGKKLYYMMRLENNSYDLCLLDTKKGGVKVLQKGTSGAFYPGSDSKTFYLLRGGNMYKLDTGSDKISSISFLGEYEYRPAAEREYIFDHIWKQVSEKFYDPQIHGTDWAAFRDNYKQFLPYINNNFDFQELLSEMLGELNGSHTGARYSTTSGYSFAKLGALYDYAYDGDGLMIKELLPGGPLANADSSIKPGDIIEEVDGIAIKKGEDWYHIFEAKANKRVLVKIRTAKKDEKELYVRMVSSNTAMLYKRWVRQREDMVRELSGGRIGYVHVADMDSDSFREAYSKILGKYRACDAVIVDTRHNGGGWLHDDLATLLSGKAYIDFMPRGQYIGTEPYNKWTKPSCVLIGEDNYSDACGFPYVYKTLGIGKLIGAPVPGTMTAVWWETQVDDTLLFGIPEVGSYALKEGRYLENFQIEPDILVYNDPASVLRGEDKQLEAAVKEMLKEISK